MTCFRFFKATTFIFAITVTSQVFGQYVVDNAGDAIDDNIGDGSCKTAGGVCTLRAAVQEANADGVATSISFSLPAGTIIQIDSELLLDFENTTSINGDFGNDGKPDIRIQAGAAGIAGFHILSGDNTIQGLNFIQFSGSGTNAPILIDGAGAIGNTIITNYFGTSLAGDNTTGTGNFRSISVINGATGNMIGNGTVTGRNIISGNSFGISIIGSNNNQVIGNIIGLDITGAVDLGNSDAGITVSGATGTIIGGAGDRRNFISGNGSEGILLNNASSTTILNNYIGTNFNGDVAIRNDNEGIRLEAGSTLNQIGDGTAGGRNIISGNNQEGVEINNSNDNTLIGNYIGLTANGIFALGNTNDGIFISGTSANNTIGSSGQGNVISGNNGRGITIAGDANFVYGNFIGIQSGGNGLLVGNTIAGIVVTGSNNEIGDALAGRGNVISANGYGIGVSSGADNIIEGNYIGLNSVGNFALPNSNEGIRITGTAIGTLIGDGTAAGANYISGNGTDGISISGVSVTNITIDYNIIGTEIDGVSPMGNGGNGIFFDNDTGNNLVQNSVIANNADNGIEVNGGAALTIISQNSIYNNTKDGIRIGSGPPNPPSVDNISLTGDIDGTSDASATVEIFFDAADEGQSYLATVVADVFGDWSYTASLSDFPPGLLNVTATQFSSGFTSEFSAQLAVPFTPFVVINTNDTGAGSLRWVMENANVTAGIQTITFNIPVGGPGYINNAGNERWTISQLTDLPEITDPVIVDATTQPGGGNFKIKLDGQGVLSNGFTVSSTPTEFYGLYITDFSTAGIFANNPGGGGIFVGDIGKGNVINACLTGISTATASNHVIKGNFIGTDETGMSAVPNITGIGMTTATNVVIGGSLPGEGNVISGNTGTGIRQNVGNNHYYEGNFIGTNALGTAAIPNDLGIQFGSSVGHVVVNNVISGNVNSGIRYLNSGSTTIHGNKIGVGLNGTDPIPNGRGIYGFSVNNSDNNVIGGTGAGEPNIIAHNTNQGILFENANHDNNQFIGNLIFCNGGKGIDLNGVANLNKSAPVITDVLAGSVSGTGDNGDVIHAYRDNGGCEPIQGKEYLGMTTVALGVWSVNNGSIVATDLINATATDVSNNTSEFAINFREPPVAYNATQVTNTDFVANFSIPASSDDILIDVADNIGFSTPLIQDLSVGLTGAPTIFVGLTPGTDYYFRVRSQVGAGFSAHATSNSFRVSPGNALDFDGVNDYVQIPDDPSLRFGSGDFTIEAWIYPTALTGNMGFNAIITKHNNADGSWLFRITQNASTGNVPKLNFETDAPAVRHYANTEVTLNQWHHIAVVLESGTGTFYLDGISDGTFANSEVFTTLEDVLISGQGDQTDERFTGQMDEIRLWNSAKSQPEIQSNMFNTLVGNEANLVAYYRFDQGTAGVVNTGITTLPDRSLNGNDGTLTNFDMGLVNVLISNWVNSLEPEIATNLLSDGTHGLNAPEVILTWDDNSVTETDYEIQRATDAGFSTGLQTFTLGSPNAGATATFSDNTVVSGTLYFYRIRTIKGAFISEYSNTITAVPVVEAGNAASFDAVPEFVSVSPSIQNRTEWTFTCWFNGRGYIYSEGSPANRFYIEATNRVRVLALNGGWVSFDAPYLNGQWNFLAISLTGGGAGTGTLTMVVNNTVQVGTLQSASGTLSFAVFGKNVGDAFGGQPAFEFTGEIDEASIWSRALTSSEMLALRDSGIPSGDPDLLGLWHFDESNSSTLVYDASGNDNHGTRTNNPQQVISKALHPFAPESFDVIPVNGEAELFWIPSYITDFQQYNILYKRDADAVYTTVQDNSQATNSMLLTGLNNNDLYNFKISATDVVDQLGVEALNNEVPTLFAGNAASFDGTNSVITVPDNAIFDRNTGLTLEAWIRPDNPNNSNQFIAGVNNAFRLSIDVNDQIEFLTNDGGGGVTGTDPAGVLPQGQWVHVAMTFQSTTANLYLNGTLVHQNTSMPVPQNSTQEFTMGAAAGGSNFFNGLIDEVRLWDQEVDQTTLQTNMFASLRGDETGVGLFGANLIGLWHFDEPTGHPTAYSTPSNLYDGTLNGNADFVLSNAMASPEIEVFQGIDNTGNPITDGQVTSVDFGSSIAGTDVDVTFAIENTGTSTLNISGTVVSGDPEFSVITPPPATIAVGATATFVIRMSAVAAGTFSGTVTITSDDLDEGTFDFPVTGTVMAPEINVYQGSDNTGVPIADGQVTSVDFGSSITGTDVDVTFAIENTGTSALNISGTVISGDPEFSVITSPPVTIAVGATATFVIRISAVAAGTFSGTLTITSDDLDEGTFDFPVTGTITATPEPEINLYHGSDNTGTPVTDGQVASVDLGSVLVGIDIDQTFAIENVGAADLTISGITVSGTDFTIQGITPTIVAVGATETFTVRLSGVSAGTFNATVTINNDDSDEAVFDFPVTGIIIAPEIGVLDGVTPITDGQATAVDAGSAIQGTDIDKVLTIENTGTADLNITSIMVAGPDFSILAGAPTLITAGGSTTFTLRLSGAATGTFNDVITILNDDADEGAFDFPVTGTITAVPVPEIGVLDGITPITDSQATVVDVGSAIQGTDIDKVFTIENTGTADLNITSVTVAGPDFSILAGAPTLITAGGSATFTLRLSGAATGTFNDVVTILNDDADEGTFDFPVTGTITAPEITVYHGADNLGMLITDGQATSIDFGSALEGVDIDQTFAIENGGTADLIISGISVSGTDFSIVGATPATVIAGATATFTIRLSGVAAGTFDATVTITSNDSDESVFDFNITGRIDMLAMLVRNGNNNTSPIVINGQPDPVDLGQTPQFVELDEVFIIENTGSNVLNIFSITTDNNVFTVIDAPSSVAPGTFEQFIIRLSAQSLGVFTTTVSVDSDAGNYSFFVTGEVLDIASPPITVYNVVSPDGNGIHDFLKIINIEAYPDNLVVIYDRFGNKVFEISGYTNNDSSARFEGKTNTGRERMLESGTYYYLIDKGDGSNPDSGFFLLNR